ncbi:hypothetical protein HGA91_03400 [candidate division WWE3 bacterium]|nr:hypothetical protein [candidate division WWE3 bacterium]
MRLLIREIITFFIIMIVSLGVIMVIVNAANLRQGMDQLTGTIEKKELRISSPVYGIVEELPIYDGQLIHKNQIIAVITPITDTENPLPTINSAMYRIENNKIYVISPAESIVSGKEVAAGSTVKALDYFVSLQPFDDSTVIVELPSKTDLSSYTDFFAQNHATRDLYQLNSLNLLPTASISSRSVQYVMSFNNPTDAKNFVDSSAITVLAKRTQSSFAHTVSDFFVSAGQQINIIPQAFSHN